MLLAVWCGGLPFLTLVLGITFLSLWEFYTLSDLGGYSTQLWTGLAAGLLLALSFYTGGTPVGARNPGVPFLLTLIPLALFFIEFLRPEKGHSLLRISTTLLGILITAWPLGHLFLLRDLRLEDSPRFGVGRALTYFGILTLWIQDIGGWLVGNAFGQKRLAHVNRPRKTWEGAAGGWLACILFGVLFREIFLKDVFGPWEIVWVSAGLSLLAQVSDLAASFLKRSLGAKDFSSLLPGHGGILDRFDSFLFTIPLFYYYLIGTGRFQ